MQGAPQDVALLLHSVDIHASGDVFCFPSRATWVAFLQIQMQQVCSDDPEMEGDNRLARLRCWELLHDNTTCLLVRPDPDCDIQLRQLS